MGLFGWLGGSKKHQCTPSEAAHVLLAAKREKQAVLKAQQEAARKVMAKIDKREARKRR